MAIKQLTPEQVRTMSLEEKDTWWLENVYRGDMPQLTLRSGLTGFFLGAFLSLTNLYISARTGWALGVGITSVIVAFAFFKVLSRIGLGKEMTLLENNAMQSIATSAGYMNQPLTSSLAAYTMVTMQIIPLHQAMVWLVVLALLGVLFAFPMKKRFINDEQQPFPEGMAAGVVMDALHEADEREGLFKAKLLVAGGLVSAAMQVLRSEKIMRAWAAMKSLPEYWDEFLYAGGAKGPTLLGTSLKSLTIRFDTSLVFIATGGLMGIRAGVSLLVGGVLNYFILAPIMISHGIILPGKAGTIGFREITIWALWGGVACMTTSSLYSFFAKPEVILQSFRGIFASRSKKEKDVIGHIELPIKVSIIGVPILSVVIVVLGHAWFGISYLLGALAVPMVFVFALIATNATGLTSITPLGPMAKLTQLSYAMLAPKNITTNLMTAGITSEVSSNTANLLMDIKPGYMLGGKPRHQAVGHCIGIISGVLLSVPVWYWFLIEGDVGRYGSEHLPVPAAQVWKAVAEVLLKGLSFLHPTARYAVLVGAIIGVVLEIAKQVTKGRFPLSGVGIGLAFVLPFWDIWTMFLGSFIFWVLERRASVWAPAEPGAAGDYRSATPRPTVNKPWYVLGSENSETICAGVIAGGSLIGIAVTILELKLPDVATLRSLTKVLTPFLHQ